MNHSFQIRLWEKRF